MKRALAIMAALVVALTGCSSSGPEPTPTATSQTPTPSPTPTPTPTPPPLWPLTGLPAPNHDGAPLIAVKVENSRAARPQTGLEGADIVVVEMVESGLTRYHALYNSVIPPVVGPVRSVRPMDAAILGPWQAALVYSGGQPQFERRVAGAGIQLLYEDPRFGFFRDRSRPAPHNLYVRLPEAIAVIERTAPPAPMFQFSETPPVGAPVAWLRAQYPTARSGWEWDAASGSWLRFDDGVASVAADATTRLRATNVLVLRVATRDTGLRDSAGAPVPETILTGSGELSLFSGGQVVTGTWSKGGDNDPFVFTDAAGQPLLLRPGTTWVELLPVQGTLETGAPQ